MYRLLITFSLTTGTIAGVGVFVAIHHVVPETQILTTLQVARYKSEPFTGVGYELWKPWQLHKLMFFINGAKIGTERHWYPDGAPWIEREYARGLPHGEWRQWYPDGQVKSLAHYKDGQSEGETWAWHQNGELAEYRLTVNGEDVTQKSWISDGTVFTNFVFQDGQPTGIQGDTFCKVKKGLKQ